VIDGSSLTAPESEHYEYDVNGVVMTMKLSLVGDALLNSLTRDVWIVPHYESGQNAAAVPIDRLASEVAGQQSHSCLTGQPKADASGKPVIGTGSGSESRIHFTPGEFLSNSTAGGQSSKIEIAMRRDEVLFHEMVHSLRQTFGVMDCTAHADGYDTRDEVWAVMTTNVYCSAFRRPLRKNHQGFDLLTDSEAKGFYKKYESMIERMCRELPYFTRTVGQIDYIRFNPFREYYRSHA
jgi:hypothetical protein